MKKGIVWAIIIILLVASAGVGFKVYQEYQIWTSPWGNEDDRFIVEIEEGKSATQIANTLKEKGVLHNINMFLIMADIRGIGDKLKAGEYEFLGTQSPYQVLDMLATGDAYERTLVIPEGFTQIDIAEACEATGICSKEDFLQQCRDNPLFSRAIAQAPEGAAAGTEGTLFPDTYYYQKDSPPSKVFNRMRRRFEEKWNELYQEARQVEDADYWWQDEDINPKLGIQAVVIMASIIEKEAKHDEERPLMASVFVNRLKKGMRLQSDSTIHYALNDWTRPLTTKDLELDSPYNTYKNKGLPPAAICNPGVPSLRAAMMPPETDYLFFITMQDGKTVFTETHREHINKKRELKQSR